MKELFANQVCEGDIQEITQHISDFFKSVCDYLSPLSSDNDYLHLEVPYVSAEYVLSVEKVGHHLHKLDTGKAHGPDYAKLCS